MLLGVPLVLGVGACATAPKSVAQPPAAASPRSPLESPAEAAEPTRERFTQVSAGWGFACAIRSDKTLLCWGDDELGESSQAPAGQFDTVRAGFGYGCAIASTTHKLVCWGRDDEWKEGWLAGAAPQGQFDDVYVGEWRACAIRTGSGHLVCWGRALGRDVVWDNHGWARDIPFANVWIDRDFVCGVRRDNGELACSPTDSPRVLPEGPFVQVYNHCALRETGETICFPVAYKYDDEPVPQERFSRLATGSGFEPCGLVAQTGRVVCWHGDASGFKNLPDVAFTSLSTSWGLACGIRAEDGAVTCWGEQVDEGRVAAMPPYSSSSAQPPPSSPPPKEPADDVPR